MGAPQNVIAVIFDFDDTLTEDSTTQLLKAHDIDTDEFWGKLQLARVKDGWDPTVSYMSLILERVGKGKPLGRLTNEGLREFGKGLEFYPGLPGMFNDLREMAATFKVRNPQVEFYIVSGGLEEIIRGSSIAEHVNGIYGCRYATDEEGVICQIKNVISFTEKTRFIFEINKGINVAVVDSRTNPYTVNEAHDNNQRRIPFPNMIYVGDGLTDVPCFSLIQHAGGRAFGVFDPSGDGKAKKAWQKLLAPKRVDSLNSPKYREEDDLGSIIRAVVHARCTEMDLEGRMAV